MGTIYKLVGYDRQTERATVRHSVPARLVDEAKQIVGARYYDETLASDLPLTAEQARRIATLIGVRIDLDRAKYLLEPGRPAARLVPIEAGTEGRRIGVAKGRFVAPVPDPKLDAAIAKRFKAPA